MPRPLPKPTEEEKEAEAERLERRSGKPPAFQTVKGMHDILPKDQVWWNAVASAGREVSELHDFDFIETPIVEDAGLFEATLGATTDIIEKQMYTMKTKGGELIALRPEGTASVMRSYFENHLSYFSSPLKVYYAGPMFRYEKPQAGRYRQFHQWGFEIVGDPDPFYDAEVILTVLHFFKALGLPDLLLKINTIGCRVCRPSYRKKLTAFYKNQKKNALCADCVRRLEKNPLRLLDCKNPECRAIMENVPTIFDHLCQSCNTHFKNVLELIEDNNIAYQPDPRLVRGLDYYSKTVFEIFDHSGEGSALGGGGRYDYLGEAVNGRIVPAVGASIGMERLIEYIAEKKIQIKPKKHPNVFFIAVGEQAKKSGLRIMNQLRLSGIKVFECVGKKSLKSQLRAADKASSPFALIFGQKEAFEGSVIIRDMKTGVQETLLLTRVVEEVKRRLK